MAPRERSDKIREISRGGPPGPAGRRGTGLLILALLTLTAGATGPLAAQTTPPGAAMRTFDTPHFRVVYEEGLRELAERAAAHAEEAHRILSEHFFPPPQLPIELLVTDHSDLSNGFASSTPLPRIVLWVRSPMDGTALSHFDEWLRLVTVHEVAHVFHLEHTGTLGRAARRVFGRAPWAWPFFTGHLLPLFAIEGVAVQLESEHTSGGRLHGTQHLSTAHAQALSGGVERLDQALGISPVHPGGQRPYIFGSLFFAWIEEEFGEGTVRDFLDASARQWIPLRLDAAAREATGEGLVELWERWRAAVEAEAEAAVAERQGAFAEPELLTRGARGVRHPVVGFGEGAVVVYLRSDGRSDPAIVARTPAGEERRIARWHGGGPLRLLPGGEILGAQPEFIDPWRLRDDLVRVDREGRAHRLTRGARLSHPDHDVVSGWIVAVEEGEGSNRLLLLDAGGEEVRELRPRDPAVHWAFPAWAPDGDRIAVVRWDRGGRSAIVLLDPEDRAEEVVVHEDAALHTTPAWSPDGSYLVWASDRDGALNLYAQAVMGREARGPLLQGTASLGGSRDPAVDPAGEYLYFTLQGRDGWDLARIPWDPDGWVAAGEPLPRFALGSGDPIMPGVSGEGGVPSPIIVREDRPWSPWHSLLPRYWFPVFAEAEEAAGREALPFGVGIETSGRDLIGRHAWSFTASAAPSDPGLRREASGRWRFAGLGQPVISLELEQRHRALGSLTPANSPGDTLLLNVRERRAGLAGELLRQRVRSALLLTMGVSGVRESRGLLELDGSETGRFSLNRPERSLTQLRVGIALSTARAHAFSVSTEEGVTISLQGRDRSQRALPDSLVGVQGVDGSFREGVGIARAFVPVPLPEGWAGGYARGVLALRGVAGVVEGPGAGAGHFRIGGGGDGFLDRNSGTPTFGVRGHPAGAWSGDRAWAGSAEMRLPLALFHRGRGALPLHLDRMAWGLFADAGGAWRHVEEERVHGWRSSVGIEGALLTTALFRERYRLRGGVAWPLEGDGGTSAYFRLGWSH